LAAGHAVAPAFSRVGGDVASPLQHAGRFSLRALPDRLWNQSGA
jgi:hypothetical protein